MALQQPRAHLNNGLSIPLVGFGTAASSRYTFQQIKDAIAAAIEVGYRHIDTASLYGSEAAVGAALSDAFQAGTLARKDIFVTSKIWCSEMDDVQGAIKRSLRLENVGWDVSAEVGKRQARGLVGDGLLGGNTKGKEWMGRVSAEGGTAEKLPVKREAPAASSARKC
ncbi:hypothetical protein GOP47_0028558 [Adiantum capillus-veneris]|nr:hypothetical protein GOP47_0028558 [Adiantum capillus-veneris]